MAATGTGERPGEVPTVTLRLRLHDWPRAYGWLCRGELRRRERGSASIRRILTIAAATLALLVTMPLLPAGATVPADVEIVVPGFEGPFVATGSAVDDGIVCARGEVETTFVKAAGFQSGFAFNLTVGKEFTCLDGYGTFSAKLQVRVDPQGATSNWVVTGGSGDYEKLHGTGSVFVVPIDTDIYQGGLHID